MTTFGGYALTRTVVLSLEVWRGTCRIVAPCGARWWSNDELLAGKTLEVAQHARECVDCRMLTPDAYGYDG